MNGNSVLFSVISLANILRLLYSARSSHHYEVNRQREAVRKLENLNVNMLKDQGHIMFFAKP